MQEQPVHVVDTVLPEIFVRVLFSLNFAVGVGPQKLSARNFCARENFDRMEFIATARGMTSYTLWSCCFAHLSVFLSRQAPDDVTRSMFPVGVPHVLHARGV